MNDNTGLYDEYERELYMMRVRAGRDEYFDEGDRPFVVSDSGRQTLVDVGANPLGGSAAVHDALCIYLTERARLDSLIGQILTGEHHQDDVERQTAVVVVAWREYVTACQAAPAPGMYVSGLIEVAHRDLLDQNGANHDSV